MPQQEPEVVARTRWPEDDELEEEERGGRRAPLGGPPAGPHPPSPGSLVATIAAPQQDAYRAALSTLEAAGIEHLVGGGFALHQYLGRFRPTKDLDVFLRERDVEDALAALSRSGFAVELTDRQWLGKARRDGVLVDLIFSSCNGLFAVGDEWFDNARAGDLLGMRVRLVGPEEMIVSKAFVAARDRFDGSDIAWLLRTLGAALDWDRIERQMTDHWEVLLWQLIHFRYVFPEDRDMVPQELFERLLRRARDDEPPDAACRGHHFDTIHYGPLGSARADGSEPRSP